MKREARRLPAALTAATVVLLAGCGTTVNGVTATTPAPGAEPGLGSATPGTDGLTAPAAGVPVGGSTGGGAVVGPRGTASGGGSGGGAAIGSAGTAGQPGAAAAVSAPGVTDTKVYIGLYYSPDAAAADRAIGAAGAAPTYDRRDVYNAVIEYANEHGAFAGRELEPVYHEYNTTTDKNVQDQSACSDWTQDNHVFVLPGFRSDILRTCAEKTGAVSLTSGDGVRSTFERFPHFIDPYYIRLDRLGPVTVNGLHRAGYFTGRLGLVTWDDPNYKYAIQHGYLPALSALGIEPAETAYISVPQQVGAIGDTSAAVQSAITKFRSEGIDHVIVQDGPAGVFGGAGLTLEWMNQAKSQHYYPRYGQNAANAPGWDVLPADQMDKAIAIMESDSDKRYDEGWHTNQTREKCFAIEAKAGYPVSSSNQNDEGIAAQACDEIFFIQQTLNSLETISADSFVQAVEGFGTSFRSAFVYGTRFAPNRHDGADRVRQAEYFQSCKCLKYSGPPYYPD